MRKTIGYRNILNERILYITGSFPRLGDGIGDAAGMLYSAIPDKDKILLVTSDVKEIRDYVLEKKYENVMFVPNWKIKSVRDIYRRISEEHIARILIEYAGNGYRRDFTISFLPLIIRLHNLFSEEKIQCHIRLHEFTMCRFARKMLTYPLVWFCHHLDTPSYVEYQALTKKYGRKVMKSSIGSNIHWRKEQKIKRCVDGDKIKLAFFGGIYPGKGIEKLIDIWSKLEKEYPEQYEYQLLGGFPTGLTNAFDDYQTKIKHLLKTDNLLEKITISGFLPEEDIEQWLDDVDIAVLPYEDGLTLRRGSFLAFLCRNVAIVTTDGDAEAKELFSDAIGVKMCPDSVSMIQGIREFSENNLFYRAGLDNARFEKYFKWDNIAETVLGSFESVKEK